MKSGASLLGCPGGSKWSWLRYSQFGQVLPSTVGRIASRSGLSTRSNIKVGAGWIDSDYRGQVSVELKNLGSTEHKVAKGDRIAQLIILPVVLVDLQVTDELSATERGAAGFGSTDS